jgi:hypothetical protein
MSQEFDQWIRKISLIVSADTKGIDLSAFRIRFTIQNADVETPNNAIIRVYNLSQDTINEIRGIKGEYSAVTLNAGYENGNFGVIFSGTIVQFRVGRESNVDTYLDLLAMDGDIGYNQGIVNGSISKGSKPQDAINAAVAAMQAEGGYLPQFVDKQHTPNIRGVVLFGLARAKLRYLADSIGATWSIQNGQVNVVPMDSYIPGEAVKINRGTGLIGMPEQTDGGLKLQCLLNPKIKIGQLIQLNNEEFNQLIQRDPDAASIAFNQWAGFQYNTPLSKDGTYRAYVVEHQGDTRGNDWFSNLVCLAVDLTTGKLTNEATG